jgi:hypothetical protein
VTRVKAKKYKHETAVLDDAHLEARCFENGTIHWRGQPHDQTGLGLGMAYALAARDLSEHVAETGHTAFKNRHGGAR